ncbi:MAG TPA: hypothetical protein VM118_09580 [Acidobacteriota bacterium]|nr:hypothetical protein [Acidobacteriota bacterium]
MAQPASLCRDSATVIGNGSDGPFWFTGFFVVRQSDCVRHGVDTLSSGADYAIDYNRGQIRLHRPLDAGDTLKIDFTRLGWALPTRLTLDDPGAWKATLRSGQSDPASPRIIPASVSQRQSLSTARGVSGGATSSGLAASSIRWRGFKSFAVTAGTRSDPSWSQGLELTVDGELTKGLMLRAAVSDRLTDNLAARHSSAVGTRLDRLDRLFIEARSARFFGRWGEMTLGSSPTPRRAAGLQVRWQSTVHSTGAHLARAQGRWVRRPIPIRPGDAGPYSLSAGMQTGGVVRGSVSIWLDGRRLQEGPENDYALDPSRGTILFTPTVTLTAGSRCVVEYEEMLDTYRRTLAGADWSWRSADSTRSHRLAVAWEGDDPSHLVSGTLSDDARTQLAEADAGSVAASAAEWVGRGQGDYSLTLRDAGDSVFVYAGPENGEWRVRFENVGLGRGRYRHLINEVYEYVGPGLGAYEPITTVTAPRSELTITESLDLSLGKGGNVDAVWTGVALDPNRFRDGNTDFAGNHRLGWTIGHPVATGTADGLRWEWYRQGWVDESGRDGDVFDRMVRTWNLRPHMYDTSFSEHTVSSSVRFSKHAGLSTEGGIFRGTDLAAWRGRGTGTVRFGTRADLTFTVARREARRHQRNGPADRSLALNGKASWDPGPARLEIGGSEEDVDNPQGLFDPSVAYAATRWVSLSRYGVTARHLWEKSIDTTATGVRRARELSLQVPATVLGAQSGSGLTVARGTESVNRGAVTPYYRGRLHAQWQPVAATTVLAEMQLIRAGGGTQRVVYLPTRPGTGSYRYERGEYVPDPNGDYRRVTIDDDVVTQSAYDGTRRLTVRWRPTIGGWRVALESRRENQGRYTPRRFRPGHWLLPWEDHADAMLPGSYLTTGDYHLVSIQPDAATDVDWQLARDRRIAGHDASGTAAAEIDTRLKTEVALRRRFQRRWFVEGAAAYETRRRTGGTFAPVTATGRTLAVTIGAANTIARTRDAATLAASIQTRRRIDHDDRTEARIGLWGVRPNLRVNWRGVRVNATTDATWVDAGTSTASFSALLAEGRPPGFSITESIEVYWELPERVTLKARVSGDQREVGSNRWRMNIETVARF